MSRIRMILALALIGTALTAGLPTFAGKKDARRLFDAAEQGDRAEVRRLLDAGFNRKAVDESGSNALVYAAHSGDTEILRMLIEHGVDVNTPNTANHWSPLHGVVRYSPDHLEGVRLLLNSGARSELRNAEGWDAVMIAARHGSPSAVVDLLISHGAEQLDPTANADGWTALMHAARHNGDPDVVRRLLASGWSPASANPDGWTSPMLAARRDDPQTAAAALDILEQLVRAAQPTERRATTSQGWTALHLAARYFPDPQAVALLIDEGWPIDATQSAGWTPLMLAITAGHEATVRTLLDRGASISNTNNQSQTALDVATAGDHPGIATLLQDAERRTRVATTMQRDARLSTSLRRDKYMVALTTQLKQENFLEALFYFEMLESIEAELPSSFSFYYGEALLRTGQAKPALEKLYDYLERVGSEGEHYPRALELVNEAETGA